MLFLYLMVVVFLPLVLLILWTAKCARDEDFAPLMTLIIAFGIAWTLANLPIYEQVMPYGVNPEYGKGKVEGIITEVAYKGMWHKTYEIVLVYDTENPEIVKLSTKDPILGTEIHDNVGKKATIYYDQWAWAPRCEGATPKIINDVLINNAKVPDAEKDN